MRNWPRLIGYSSSHAQTATFALGSYSAGGRITFEAGSSNGFYAAYGHATTSRVIQRQRVAFTGSSLVNHGASNYISAYANNLFDLEGAHSGHWMLARNNGGVLSLYSHNRWDSTVNYFTAPQVTTPSGHMAVVLAPEPGTMAALALGIGAILRKRRKKS